jgi:hypothetical protein
MIRQEQSHRRPRWQHHGSQIAHRTGSELSGREQFLPVRMGALHQTGHVVMQWEESSSGLEIVQAAEWNYRGAGLVKTSSYPADVGVSQIQIIWLFYSWQYGNTQIVWTDATGKLLGIAGSNLATRSQMVGVDGKQTYYICGTSITPGAAPRTTCIAYSQGSTEPLWEMPLEGAVGDVIGAALVEGRLYVATGDGKLFAIGEREAATPSETEVSGGGSCCCRTHSSQTPKPPAQWLPHQT